MSATGNQPTPPPRRPRVYRRYKAPYSPGDCLAVRLSDGDWGAALVLATDGKGRGNLVGLLHYKGAAQPNEAVFQKRDWLILTHHSHQGRNSIEWCDAKYYQSAAHLLQVVAHIEITDNDPKTSYVFGGWNLSNQIEMQFAWDLATRTPCGIFD